jgi:hypothetical protein
MNQLINPNRFQNLKQHFSKLKSDGKNTQAYL